MYYTQIRANAIASALTGGLDGFTTYTATPGQIGFPTCLTGPCLPVAFDPRTLPPSQQPARNITIRAGRARLLPGRSSRQYGLNFDLLPNYPDEFVNPRSQVTSIGAEREVMQGPVRRRRLRAPALDRPRSHRRPERADAVRSHGDRPDQDASPPPTRRVRSCRSTAACAAVNVLMNLGVADYDGLQTQISYRGNAKMYADLSYTLSKATNTTEPDGNGIGAERRQHRAPRRRGARPEPARSAPSRGHHVHLPAAVQPHRRHRDAARVRAAVQRARRASTTTATARTTIGRSSTARSSASRRFAAPGRRTSRCSSRSACRSRGRRSCCGWRASTSSTTANILGRAQTIYGDTATVNPTFGQLVSVGTATNAHPGAREHRSAADVPVPGCDSRSDRLVRLASEDPSHGERPGRPLVG